MVIAQSHWAQALGLSALTVAVTLGVLLGNTIFPRIAARAGTGVDFSRTTLLRTGIVLYGLKITFQQIAAVGARGVLIDVVMLCATFLLAAVLGPRLFKLDRETALLIGAGSAICGAAAVVATEPVVKAQAHKVSTAVATVVVFGTLAMFLYPLCYPLLGLSQQAYGIYVGSTVHEVAHVVAAARSIGDAAASPAVVEKMLRVMMLAPFLMLLAWRLKGMDTTGDGQGKAIAIPWFAVFFIGVSAINSLQVLPESWNDWLLQLDTVLLAMAMAALGLRTHVSALRQAGASALLLAATLFLFLTVGGYAINRGLTLLLP